MNTYNFSFYNGPISNVKPHKIMRLHEAMELIKSDKYKIDVEKLRASNNPATKSTLKKHLPYFTFSGTFTKRLNDALIKHSGLIVLDFDGLNDLQIDDYFNSFITIEWVCGCWVSPSGNGLKVLVKINPKYHLLSFNQLADFFLGNFNLDIDQSGKDVSRACFVSSYENLFYNPSSIEFPLDFSELIDENIEEFDVEVNTRNIQSAAKVDKDLLRVQHVVEQIERDKVDITDDDYDNRLTIGFALATLGEEAYELYARAIQFNDNDEDPRAKFDDALKKGKFKTPAKFFSLAKDHGLAISLPRTIEQANKDAELRVAIPDENSFEEQKKYGIHYDKKSRVYYSVDSKGIPRPVSNFSLRILYHINTGADEAYRLMQITNIHGLDKTVRMNTDDFVSAGSFKKVIARLGNFIWKGSDSDLVRLQDMLQRHEKHTEMISTLGWNKRGKFYAFANGLFDTNAKQFLPADAYGIVEKLNGEKQINYFIPALSKVFADKEDLYTNEKKFVFVNSPIEYEKWAKQYVKVFGDNGKIGLVFWVCCLFSDILFRSMGQRMPMPFSYGKRGSGKGTMIQSLTRLWGEKQDQIMLGGATTVVGFMRKMAQFSNAMVWLDEYKNSLNPKVIESIKNLYDRIGYERGKKDNAFTTESTPILSAVFLSGQEMPTIEPALFTRTFLLTFNETKRTEEARKKFRELQVMEEIGLSHLSVNMLAYRNDFEAQYQENYENELRELAKDVNNSDVDERLLGNYSMLLATARLLEKFGLLFFSFNDFKNVCIENLMHQYFILKGSDDTSKFWQVVEQLVGVFTLRENEHYKLANGYLYIFIQDVYHHYVKAMNDRREVNILDKPTLENYLKSDAKSFVAKKKMSIGQKYSGAMQFNYKELDIDIIRGESETLIKAKYQEMKMDYQKEDLLDSSDNFNDGFNEPNQISMDLKSK